MAIAALIALSRRVVSGGGAGSARTTTAANATSSNTNEIVTLTNLGATTSTGSTTVYNASFSTVPSVGQIIIGNGVPPNTTITAASSTAAQYAAGTGSLTISQAATTPSQ